MATIIKNGKRWRAQVWREQISHFFDSSRRKKWAEMLEKQLESGKYNEIPDITLDELIDKYLKEVTVTKCGKPIASFSNSACRNIFTRNRKAHFREW